MRSEDRDHLRRQLIRDEGLRLKPYTDTVGKLSIGVGRNLTDNGITQGEAHYLLDHDIVTAVDQLSVRHPELTTLDPARLAVLINMMFNMGPMRFNGFRLMLRALRDKDFEGAAVEMLASRWAEQVGDRALRLSEQMRTGAWI